MVEMGLTSQQTPQPQENNTISLRMFTHVIKEGLAALKGKLDEKFYESETYSLLWLLPDALGKVE